MSTPYAITARYTSSIKGKRGHVRARLSSSGQKAFWFAYTQFDVNFTVGELLVIKVIVGRMMKEEFGLGINRMRLDGV